MDDVKDVLNSVRSQADVYFDKTATFVREASQTASRQFEAAKSRCQIFMETGAAHYWNSEERVLAQIKDGVAWLNNNPAYAGVIAGTATVLLLPHLRRSFFRISLRPFRSDESIYRSAEARMESIQEHLKSNGERTEKLQTELTKMLEAFTTAREQLRTTGRELESFSNQVHRDIRSANELLRDMRELPGRPSLRMQSDAAMALSALEKQNRQVDQLLYKVMQQGI